MRSTEYMRISSTAQRGNHGAQQINRGALMRSTIVMEVNKVIKRLNQRIVYLFFMLFGVLVRRMSRRRFERFSCLIGDVAYHVLRVRRALVETNLSLTFPEKPSDEIGSIAQNVYRRQVLNLFEVLRLPLLKNRIDAAKLLDIDGREFLRRTKESGKGGVVISAHFGNWELLGICTGMLVTPMNIVVKKLKNPFIDARINSWRTQNGNSVLYKRHALRSGIEILEQGDVLTILGDQSDPKAGFVTEFLGRRASSFLGPSFLALKTGVPVFVGMCRRREDGRYLVEVEEVMTSDLAFSKKDIEELTRRYTGIIERHIYRYPEEWFWMHDRWKRGRN